MYITNTNVVMENKVRKGSMLHRLLKFTEVRQQHFSIERSGKVP